MSSPDELVRWHTGSDRRRGRLADYPHPGWQEHDPLEWLDVLDKCSTEAVKQLEKLGHQKSDIKAVGITNQRETTVVWDKKTGKPRRSLSLPTQPCLVC